MSLSFDEILKLEHLEEYIYSIQKLRLSHNWDKCYCTQVFSILDIINLIELVELDIAIGCKKNMSGARILLRLGRFKGFIFLSLF